MYMSWRIFLLVLVLGLHQPQSESAWQSVSMCSNGTLYTVQTTDRTLLTITIGSSTTIALPLHLEILHVALDASCSSLFLATRTAIYGLSSLPSSLSSLAGAVWDESLLAGSATSTTPFPRDGPRRFARFVSISHMLVATDHAVIRDGPSVRVWTFAMDAVCTLQNVAYDGGASIV